MNIFEKVFLQINKNEKNKNLFLNILGSFGVKGLSLMISVFSMPMYIKYFDNQIVLGMWFTIISMLSWIFTFDLGLGNGLRNKLVVSIVEKDYKKSKEYISSAYTILFVISLIVSIFSIMIFPFVNWNSIFNVSEKLIDERSLLISIIILFIGIMISFCLKLINSILYAIQKSAINNLIALFTSLIPIMYMFFSEGSTMEINLIKLSIVQVIAICFPLIVASIFVFNSKQLKMCKPNLKDSSFLIGKSIFKLGGVFFIVQIAFMCITAINEVIISKCFGPQYVVEYQIYNKLFTVIGSLFTLALSPLWSSITKAFAEKDYNWILKINKILTAITLTAVLAEMSIIPFLQFIVNLWLGNAVIKINYIVAILFGIYGSLFIYNVVLTTIANGIGALRTQLICYSLGAIAKIPFILFIRDTVNHWSVVVLSNILILSIFCFFQQLWLNNFINEKIKYTKKNSL